MLARSKIMLIEYVADLKQDLELEQLIDENLIDEWFHPYDDTYIIVTENGDIILDILEKQGIEPIIKG